MYQQNFNPNGSLWLSALLAALPLVAALLLILCVLVFLQSTPVLGWMRVGG